MSSPSPIRVLVVDDHALFRKGIVSLLSAEAGFEVVGEAANGREAIEKARDLMPDIVLMDLSMPEVDGLEATQRIKTELPHVRVVILTVEEADQNLFEAVKNGAQGYLLKKIEPRALFDTLRGVAQGEASISRLMAAKLMGEFSRQANRGRICGGPQPGAEPARARGAGARGAGQEQQGDRRRARRRREYGQEPPQEHPREAPPGEPRPGRHLRSPPRVGGQAAQKERLTLLLSLGDVGSKTT